MSKLKVDQISKATGASPAIFTLPAADGTVNQLMKTDGSWATWLGNRYRRFGFWLCNLCRSEKRWILLEVQQHLAIGDNEISTQP